MWTPKKIQLINFMGHSDSTFEFIEGRATMILGKNEYDSGTKSNGSGKSAILEAISVCLINSVLRRDTSSKDLVRDGEKRSNLSFLLENSITNETLKINRIIHSNSKSSELEILINDLPPKKDLTNVNDGDKFIQETLGIERDDLLNYFLISKERYTPYFRMSDTKKKEVISRFAQSNLIDPVFEDIDESINNLLQEVDATNNFIEVIEGKKEVYNQEIENYSIEGEKRKIEERKSKLQDSFKDIQEKIISIGDSSKELNCKVDEKEAELCNLPSGFAIDIEPILDRLKKTRENIQGVAGEYSGLIELEAKVRKALADTIKCPKCSHEFSLSNEKLDVELARQRHDKIKSAIEETEKEKTILSQTEQQIDLEVREAKKKNNENTFKKSELQRSITALNDEIDYNSKQISQYQDRLKQINSDIENIDNEVLEDKTVIYKEKIEELEDQIKEKLLSLDSVDRKKEQQLLLKNTLIKFKTHLANKAIGTIEVNANEYLEKTKINLSVQIDGYKQTRSGDIREKISAQILRDGVDDGGIGRHSSGEKVRVEIAIIMALQKLINNSAGYGKGLDLTWLDEIIESSDSTGIEGIIKSLDELKQTVVVITHGTFESVFDNQITVEKTKEGISTICQ